MKRIISFITLLISFSLYSQEDGLVSVRLLCTDNEVVTVSENTLKKLSPALYTMCETNLEHCCVQIANTLFYHINLNNFVNQNNQHLRPLLTSENIEILAEYVENHTLHPDKAYATCRSTIIICKLADFLGSSKKILEELAHHLENVDILSAHPLNNEDKAFIDQFFYLYGRYNIKNLLDNNKISQFCNTPFLNLYNQRLTSLKGIQLLENRRNITQLDLSNNALRTLDVSKLCRYFPNLQRIDAGNNNIENLNCNSIHTGLNIYVRNNNIQTFQFGSLNNNTIEMWQNELTPAIIKAIKIHSLKSNILQLFTSQINAALNTIELAGPPALAIYTLLKLSSLKYDFFPKAFNAVNYLGAPLRPHNALDARSNPFARAIALYALYKIMNYDNYPHFLKFVSKPLCWLNFAEFKMANLVKFSSELILKRCRKALSYYSPSKIFYSKPS